MTAFTRVSLESRIAHYFHNNQTLMNFHDDEANEAFIEWWQGEGCEVFNEWLKYQKIYKDLVCKD